MNFGKLTETIQAVSANGEPAQWQNLELTPGSREGIWSELKNLRLQADGEYAFWKPRGGSDLQNDFFGQMRSMYSFSATINGTQENYIAVHVATGAAFIVKEGEEGAPVEMFPATTFNTTEQVSMINIGRFLYIFDLHNDVFKVYNIETDGTSDWLSGQSGSISDWSWIENVDWQEDNIWDFREGRSIIALNSFGDADYIDPETQRRSHRSFITKIDKVFTDRISYQDPSGVTFESNQDTNIGLLPQTADLEDYIGAPASIRFSDDFARGVIEVVNLPTADAEFYLRIDGIKVPEEGVLTALATENRADIATTIKDALEANDEVSNNWNISRTEGLVFLDSKGKGEAFEGISIRYELVDNDDTFVLANRDSKISQSAQVNGDFKTPFVYKGYMIVDLLSDGSFTTPGRPTTVFTSIFDLTQNRRGAVELTVPSPATNVEKRILFATRWQTTEDRVFAPSTERYENGTFFFAKEIGVNQTTFTDTTPDRKLVSPLSGFLPYTAGVLQMFGANQLTPRSVEAIKNALFLGGYTINRPIPEVYTDVANPGDDNVFVSIGAGTNLTGDPTVAFLFEYTDGKKSNIVDTAHILTDAEEVIEPDEAGVQATAQFWTPQNAPGGDGTVEVEYPLGEAGAITVLIPYLSTDSIEDVVAKVVTGVNADNDIQITADPFNASTEVGFTEKREGFEYNENIVEVTYPADPLPVEVEMVGGVDGVEGITVSDNKTILHSLNALVSKVYVLAKIATDYKLIQEAESNEGFFHGRAIYLPNTDQEITDADAFTVPTAGQIRETADLTNWIVPAIPFQQPLISEQKKIEGDVPIQQIIGTRFDTDKTDLRFRLAVFTERNFQIGYITLSENQSSAEFEVVGEGVVLKGKYSAGYVQGNLIYQTKDGIYIYSQQGWNKIADNRSFGILRHTVRQIIFNREHNEFWFVFQTDSPTSDDDYTVFVCDPDGQSPKEFVFPSSLGSARTLGYMGNQLAIGLGTGLYYTDKESLVLDGAGNIACIATTRHLGNEQTKIALKELLIAGADLTVAVDVDLQTARKETSGDVWSKSFQSDFAITGKAVKMYGENYQLNKQAPMPKIRLSFDAAANGFINSVQLKSTPTQNAGKARS